MYKSKINKMKNLDIYHYSEKKNREFLSNRI